MFDLPEMIVKPVFKVVFKIGAEIAPVYILGNTEEEAVENAKKFWISEKQRITKQNESENNVVAVRHNSDHGLSGKVWMLHRVNKMRKRVNPSDIENMKNAGWEIGGPKTPF